MNNNPSFSVVIGIPTFRRPAQLSALLDSLLPGLTSCRAYVVVADNDCGEEAHQVVQQFLNAWPNTICIPVRQRGISQVRNAIVQQAHLSAPNWHWLVMFDDDGVVVHGCLEALLETGEKFGAHLVGGVVDGQVPADLNIFARNSVFAARRSWQTGLVSTLNGAQNLAISRETLSLISEPLFRNEYGASGGEDYDLFRRVARAKGRIAWCNEAVVMEPTPADRLTIKSLLGRYATTGAYNAVIDLSYDGRCRVWYGSIKGMTAVLGRLVIAAVLMRGDHFARTVLAVSYFCGRFAGLMGVRTARYVAPVKESK